MNPPEYDVSGTGCIEECRVGRVEAGKPASRYHSWSRWKTWWLNRSGGCRDVDTVQMDLDTSARFLHGPERKREIWRK